MIGAVLKWITLSLVFALISLYLIFQTYYLSEVDLNGEVIKIDRDQFGISTLHINSFKQYMYALGTVYAEDRLFQMTLRAYTVQGRLSQFLGEKTLQFDRFMRELNLKGWAQKRANRMFEQNPQQYYQFGLLADAINDRVGKMWVLPLQFYLSGIKWQNYSINHIIYLDILTEWSLSMNMVDQYTRSILLTNYTKEELDLILPNKKENWAFQSIPIVTDQQIPQRLRTQNIKEKLDAIKFNPLSVDHPIELDIIQFLRNEDATNTWVISGQHTQSGFPIIGNDPHLQALVPSQWYQTRINYTSDGKNTFFSARGTPGSPRLIGKTDYFADGISISHGDNQDLFRQKIQGNKYLVDGVWRKLKQRNETILVKTSQGLRRDEYQVKQTHRGPVIHYIFGGLGNYKLQDDTISLAWTGFNSQWQSMACMYRYFLIDNFADMRNCLQNCTKTFYNTNILVATRDNHIISQQSGLHPIRRNVQSGYYIKDGVTTEHDWVGLVPSYDRMHTYDPPKGYIVHANNKVAGSAYYGGYLDYTTYTARADRIDEMIRGEIKAGRKIGIQFARKIIYDTVDVYCRQILHEIIEVVESSKQSLQHFDCDFRSDSYKASLYQVFIYQLYHLMKPYAFEKTSLISFHYMQQGIFNYIHSAYGGDLLKQKIMKQAWKQAIKYLQNHFATQDRSKWEWGKLHLDVGRHSYFRHHPFFSHFYNLVSPGVGNFHTPNVGKMEKQQFGNFQTVQRANIRTIFTVGPKGWNQWSVDSGVSENILSDHYSDQWSKFIKNEMIPLSGQELSVIQKFLQF